MNHSSQNSKLIFVALKGLIFLTLSFYRHPEIVYVPGLTIEDCHAAIGTSFCLVNSSESEGMASAILEVCTRFGNRELSRCYRNQLLSSKLFRE